MVSSMILSSVGSFGPIMLVSALYLLTLILTELIYNNACRPDRSDCDFPCCHHVSQSVAVFYHRYICGFGKFNDCGRLSNPHNDLRSEQYEFFDFVKVGTPLNIIF
jgi:hypothetical protein